MLAGAKKATRKGAESSGKMEGVFALWVDRGDVGEKALPIDPVHDRFGATGEEFPLRGLETCSCDEMR